MATAFAPASKSANPEPNAAQATMSIATGIRSRSGRKINLLSTSFCAGKPARDLITVNMLAMKRFLSTCAIAAIASSASAALTYKIQSNTNGVRAATIAGTVTADGPRLGIDMASVDGMVCKDDLVVCLYDVGRMLA